MSGYLGWNNTGNKKVDVLMGVIETAGDGFHHTSEWSESLEYRDDGKSYLDLIQDSADSVAEQFNLLEAELESTKEELEEYKFAENCLTPDVEKDRLLEVRYQHCLKLEAELNAANEKITRGDTLLTELLHISSPETCKNHGAEKCIATVNITINEAINTPSEVSNT